MVTPAPSLAGTTPARHPSPTPRDANTPSSPAAYATGAYTTPSTNGRFVPPPTVQAPAGSTTNDAQPATSTTKPSGPSLTGSWASSTAVVDDHRALYNEQTAWAHRTVPNQAATRLTNTPVVRNLDDQLWGCSYGCQVGDGAGWWVRSQVWYRVASWWLWSRPRSSSEMRAVWVRRAWAAWLMVTPAFGRRLRRRAQSGVGE